MIGWDLDEFSAALQVAGERLRFYVAQSEAGTAPVVSQPELKLLSEELRLSQWIEHGGMDVPALGDFLDAYLGATTRLHHPGYLSHQVAPPDYPAAVGDLIHGAINNPMMVYELGPAAVAIELAVTAWMAEKIGWGPRGGGVLTHGGSLANLTAMSAARAKAVPSAWAGGTPDNLCILAPRASHYSIRKVAALLGLGESAVIPLATDPFERVLAARLPEALDAAAATGRRPIALVANACTTSSGLYDDLDSIGQFCERRGIWFHVDAAHGASALLSPRHRGLLDGIERADSVSWDAHKMLRTSALCTAVLLRDVRDLESAFTHDATYLIYEDGDTEIDLINRSFECTKSELGLKLFLNLAWRGEQGLGAYVAKQFDLTRSGYEVIRSRPGFDCPYEPEANVLCFRYGADADDDVQLKIREALLAEGRFHLSSSTIANRRYLRLSVMSPSTSIATIRELLDSIERVGSGLIGVPDPARSG